VIVTELGVKCLKQKLLIRELFCSVLSYSQLILLLGYYRVGSLYLQVIVLVMSCIRWTQVAHFGPQLQKPAVKLACIVARDNTIISLLILGAKQQVLSWLHSMLLNSGILIQVFFCAWPLLD